MAIRIDGRSSETRAPFFIQRRSNLNDPPSEETVDNSPATIQLEPNQDQVEPADLSQPLTTDDEVTKNPITAEDDTRGQLKTLSNPESPVED